MKHVWRFAALATVLMLTSCGSDTSSSGGQNANTYKDTKSMVLDLLKSDDGRKAVQSAAFGLEDPSGKSTNTGIKTLGTGDAKQLQLAVKDVLTDQQNSAFLQNLMKDPKFAGDFAKATKTEHKQILKDLMKDPEYQKLQLDTMKNPEYQKILIDTMRGMQYRQHVMTIIQESMQSPLFKTEMINLLKKAIEEGTTAQAQTTGGKGTDKGASKSDGGDKGGGDKGGGDKGSKDSSSDSGDGDGGDDSSQGDDQKKQSKKSGSSQ